MKLIYGQGFSKRERLKWKSVVFSNIIQSFKTIHEIMGELNIAFENPENEVRHTIPTGFSRPQHGVPRTDFAVGMRLGGTALDRTLFNPCLQKSIAHIVAQRRISAKEKMPTSYLEPVKALWDDSGVKAAIAKGNEYALHENLA
jgi:guanine nucleotide-binding protein subunit alpha, other